MDNVKIAAPQLSGRRFRGLLEAAPDAMVVIDQSGEIVLLNAQAEKQFGYRRDELLGQQVTTIIPDGFAERLIADDLRSAEDALTQQIGSGLELQGKRKDGSAFPLEIMLSPLDSEDGVLVIAAIRNISTRKEVERRLAETEGKYRGLLEAAPDAIVVVDTDGKIVLVNVQAEKQFGYRRDELLGQMVTRIVPDGFAERLIADDLRSAEDALSQHIGGGVELVGLRKDGREFPIEIMLSPLDSADGVLVTAAIRNISVRKHESTRVERLKDEFVSTVSHELRTPLTSITGALALLSTSPALALPEAAARLLRIAHTNSQRLVRLVNDILDIERAESGSVIFVLKSVDVRAIAEQTVEANRDLAESCGVSIRLNAPEGACKLLADADRLVQVFTNLISNAIKFSPHGETVVVSLEKHDNKVRFSVGDRGGGIPEAFKPRVFGKFAQADTSDARQKGGSGLGLSIVKKIVTMLGGTVEFADDPRGGTIFKVEIPDREAPVRGQPVNEVSGAA